MRSRARSTRNFALENRQYPFAAGNWVFANLHSICTHVAHCWSYQIWPFWGSFRTVKTKRLLETKIWWLQQGVSKILKFFEFWVDAKTDCAYMTNVFFSSVGCTFMCTQTAQNNMFQLSPEFTVFRPKWCQAQIVFHVCRILKFVWSSQQTLSKVPFERCLVSILISFSSTKWNHGANKVSAKKSVCFLWSKQCTVKRFLESICVWQHFTMTIFDSSHFKSITVTLWKPSFSERCWPAQKAHQKEVSFKFLSPETLF